MANVGTGDVGKTLIGTGSGSSPTYANVGTNSNLTNHGVLLAHGNSAFTATSVGTNGQLLIGSTGADPAFSTITSPNNTILFTTGANTLAMDVNPSIVALTITGTTGGALQPTAGNWNILSASVAAGSTPISTSGSVSTLTINVQRSQAIASTDASKVGDCAFDNSKFTVDSNGFVSTSGSGVASTITGNSGGAISPSMGNWNFLTANTTAKFVGSGSTETIDFGVINLMIGTSATSIAGGIQNVGYGGLALNAITSGSANVLMGAASGKSLTTGNSNSGIGNASLFTATTASNNCCMGDSSLQVLASGLRNTCLGYNSTAHLLTGSDNLCLGNASGSQYMSSESSNVLISSSGVTSESNTIRIGTPGSSNGQQNRAFMAGITGVTVASSQPVGVNSSGQLSSLSGTINISSAGEINYPTQPSFLAYLNTSVTDVTGDGTQYTVIYDTEVFDQNSDFNLGTSTFTAPVTGRYQINVAASLIGGTVMSATICRIVTSNRTYRLNLPLNAGVTSTASASGSVIADMDAADTFTITLQSTDTGGKIDDAAGTTGGELRNWVSAQLIA